MKPFCPLRTIILAMLVLMLGSAHISAQTPEQWQFQHCDALIRQATDALISRSWQTVITVEQRRMSDCSEIMNPKDKAAALDDIGSSFYFLRRNEEALPVLQRCVSLYPESAACWLSLGKVSEYLGRISDARNYYRNSIGTGATDRANASAIDSARICLSLLDSKHPEETVHDQTKNPPLPPENQHKFGTGFFVSKTGHIVTNNHVVAGCRTLAIRDGKRLQIVARDASADLALLKADVTPSSVAVFRGGAPPKLGEGVVVFGFPLPGILSSEGNVTTGVLSATSGLNDDVRLIQVTAPVQPGNSGGPVFDSSGHVIGVVVSKLDVIQMAEATGDIAQNVNFAVHWAAVRSFLDEQGVRYRREVSQVTKPTPNIAELAGQASVALECTE